MDSDLPVPGTIPSRMRIRTLVFANGERFPVLVFRQTGLPHYDTTLFVAQTVRPQCAHNTIRQVLQSLLVLFSFLDDLNIDLRGRCREGLVLSLGEIEDLARRARVHQVRMFGDRDLDGKKNSLRRSCSTEKQVHADTQNIRLTYIAKYIRWLGNAELYSTKGTTARALLQSKLEETLTALLERRARKSPQGLNPREGLNERDRQRLLEVSLLGRYSESPLLD